MSLDSSAYVARVLHVILSKAKDLADRILTPECSAIGYRLSAIFADGNRFPHNGETHAHETQTD